MPLARECKEGVQSVLGQTSGDRPVRPTWLVGGHRFLPPTALQLDPDSRFAIGPLAFMHATQYVKPRVALIGCALSADYMIFNPLSSVITYTSNLVNYKFQQFNTYECVKSNDVPISNG